MRGRVALAAAGAWAWLLAGCSSASGVSWALEPLSAEAGIQAEAGAEPPEPFAKSSGPKSRSSRRYSVRRLGDEPDARFEAAEPEGGGYSHGNKRVEGRVLGTFRNTYYDFPSEREFTESREPRVALKDAQCNTIAEVSREFHDTLCVQGSGRLASGMTVSFAKRDCACAALCPKSEQKICYDALRPESFPWGRGAMGQAITPLLTVAVDSTVIPLGTGVYIPELDGAPRDLLGQSRHDGCFVAQDRGIRVVKNHVDIFTGERAMTKLYNALVPSNKGVTVVLDNPRCARATP